MTKKIIIVFILFMTSVFIYAQNDDEEEKNKKLRYPSHSPNCCHNTIGTKNKNSNDSNSGIGASFQGIPGVSNYGFAVKGIASPASSIFLDFGSSVGFGNLSFNPYTNFCFILPFDISILNGSWYAGVGISFLAGFDENNDFSEEISYFSGNITTGFLLWEWLNISFTYQLGGRLNGDFFYNRFNYSTGYIYKF